MTIEKIKEGIEILNKIKHLECEKAKWEQSTYVEEISAAKNLEDRTIHCQIDTTFINFKKLKEDSLNMINDRIKECQEEFDNL